MTSACRPVTAWVVTTGEAGMRTQARGLAHAVADRIIEKTVSSGPAWPWRPRLESERLAPPWPDIVISCGRRSARASIAARRAGGDFLAVHVQDPRGPARAFDLIVAMAHDEIRTGPRVIKVATALHDLTDENLAEAGAYWADRLAHLGHPLVGVVIGGDLKGRPFTPADSDRLISGLRRLIREAGAGLAITPSRRTPAWMLRQLATTFAEHPRVFLWDLAGDNPYRGILALADRLVVTSDSVSMVSEAIASHHPVEVLDLGFARHVGFIQTLVDRRLVRRFEGDPSIPVTLGPVNATTEAAARVRALLQTRTGVSG